jgi:hypothetical protein
MVAPQEMMPENGRAWLYWTPRRTKKQLTLSKSDANAVSGNERSVEKKCEKPGLEVTSLVCFQ